MANEPPILLADEPTGNIDSHTSQEVMDLFRQLNQEDGITIILVTHDQEVVRDARRTVVLHDGRRFATRPLCEGHRGLARREGEQS